ncbi:hypothetical protein BpHYR1_028426 [Brachionus plicatilis]|uniref:Uncharacterized protein n=1 Tax=Brachionus plicatilis TaxID=10195 RepID=A0A3M7S2E8_BRAPC|nr:hypothetical protein BpHYR1_028426 [Brachionus plicatilis]
MTNFYVLKDKINIITRLTSIWLQFWLQFGFNCASNFHAQFTLIPSEFILKFCVSLKSKNNYIKWSLQDF